MIEEVGDFDSSSALSALTTFIDGQASTFASVITELKAINWSEVGNAGQLNRYNFIGDFVGFAGNEVACLATLESNGYTTENLQYAQLLNTKGTGYALNMPATGKFYRIKGYSNNYITSNAAGSNASMNGTASANNIVYYSADQNLIFFGSGYGLYNTCIVAPATATLNTYTFSEGVQSSHYNLTSNASGVGTYCYDHTGDGTKLNRNSDAVTSGNYETDWTLEEVTTLPVAISGEYASFYSPVDLTIPEGVEVYTATLNGAKDRLNMTLVESGTLPANTGVILKKTGSNNTVNFPVLTTTTPGESDLLGTVAAESCEADTKLVLGKASETWGIYNFGGTTLGGFKAYMNKSDVNTVKGLSFNFGTIDAITSLLNGEQNNGEYYDLSGRRVNAPVKGLYIVNGKKVLVK